MPDVKNLSRMLAVNLPDRAPTQAAGMSSGPLLFPARISQSIAAKELYAPGQTPLDR